MRIGKIVFNLVVCGLFVLRFISSSLAKNKFEKSDETFCGIAFGWLEGVCRLSF